MLARAAKCAILVKANVPHTVYVGRYEYVTKPSKTHYGSIVITKVLDKCEYPDYTTACKAASEICKLNGKGYACSVVPSGLLANSLSASYVWA